MCSFFLQFLNQLREPTCFTVATRKCLHQFLFTVLLFINLNDRCMSQSEKMWYICTYPIAEARHCYFPVSESSYNNNHP